jgi:hypothetical protein
MSTELKIHDLGTKKEAHPLKHSFLPSLPMRMLVVAPSNGGKSNMLKNMLLRPEFGYRDYFTDTKTGALNYFVFSRTLGADHTLDELVDQLPKFHSYREWDDMIIRDIMEYSRLKTERGVLLLLDDMITDTKAFNKCSGNLLNELAFMGRHHKVSFIITAQSYTSIQRPIRINSSAVIAFNLKNKREEQAFLDEQSMWDNIQDLYAMAMSQKYGFLYLNKETGKAYLNFEKLLYDN